MEKECGKDIELKKEIEALLYFEENPISLINNSPEDLAAEIINELESTDYTKTKVRQFEILDKIGKGGMGTVYLANDTKLERKVAIKFLDKEFSQNEERLRRFILEAKAASALNHPNILTIHEIGEIDNSHFIATEFIEGETLRQKIKRRPFELIEFNKIADQIVSALDTAHQAGIVHRDIKPENIMIRPDGVVKVLDFGLAKILNKTDANSFITQDHTENRRVMGTRNYMSPEQALGNKLDDRSDIYSLGIVFYEMLSGVQPYQGGSDAAFYDELLNVDPLPLTQVTKDIPPTLDQIIRHTIKKDPDQRYQNISDLKIDLNTFKETSSFNTQSGSFGKYVFSNLRQNQSNRGTAMFASIAAIILLAITVYYLFSANIFSKPTPGLGKLNHKQLTSESGEELFPNLSPDGKTFIYSSGEKGSRDIYFQRVSGSKPINLTNNSSTDDKQPVYSPDGDTIAFNSEREGSRALYIMGATGESVRRIADLGFYPSWSPDGTEIVYSDEDFSSPTAIGARGKLWIVNIATGVKRLIKTSGNALQPNWSPNGYYIAFWGMNVAGHRDIRIISSSGVGETILLTDDSFLDWNPVWSADGKYLYFLSNRGGSMNLWRLPIEEETGTSMGEPEPVTMPSNRIRYLSFARDGKSFIYNQTSVSTNLFKVDFDPVSETAEENPIQLSNDSKHQTNPNVSGDNQTLVFDSIGDTQEDIFIANADGNNIRHLTNNKDKDRAPRLSPDGRRVAFFSDTTGRYEGWVINSDGSDLRMITKTSDDLWAQLPVWSPDGSRLLYNTSKGFPYFFDPDKVFSEQTPYELPHNSSAPVSFFAFSWSPNGQKLAGYDHFNEALIHIWTYDFTTAKFTKLDINGVFPIWLSDNRRLLVLAQEKIFLIDSETNRKKEIFSVATKTFHSIFLSKDSSSIYYSLRNRESDIWLASSSEDEATD